MADEHGTARQRLEDALREHIPDGYRDDYGIWHDGPLLAEALADLNVISEAMLQAVRWLEDRQDPPRYAAEILRAALAADDQEQDRG